MEPSSDVSVESVDENVQKSSVNRVRKRKKQLYADLKKQLEFYLSDANLRKDRYFGLLMQTDQCVSVETFLNCNKIKSLTTNPEDIVKALESSNVLAVSECKTKIHRIKPVEDKTPEDIERCTVYVEQLPLKADHDWVKSMFEKYGNVAYISLPKFKSGTIKRFAFVEFETEESANKVLEDYKKLHEESKILPEELQSITTFNEDDKNEDESTKVEKSSDSVNLAKKRKHSLSTEDMKDKKIKIEIPKISSVSPIGNKNKKKKKKKDKHQKSEDSEQQNSSFEISDGENNQKVLLNEHYDSSIIKSEKIIPSDDIKKESMDSSIVKPEETIPIDDIKKENNVEFNNDNSIVKKKRKRNKGKKTKSETNLTTPGLRIMSKTEWRRLRNQFLNMQRHKMSLLKAQLRHSKYNTNDSNINLPKKNDDSSTNDENKDLKNSKAEDIRVKYVPGVILKINFENPIESDRVFKNEAKNDSNVQFVDIINNFEAYIRCACPDSAKRIAEENRWPKTRQLEGEEEKLYWNKVFCDRETRYLKQKETKKQRGRTKLINKAEKILTQHVKFKLDEDT